jgi:hypothetical protein
MLRSLAITSREATTYWQRFGQRMGEIAISLCLIGWGHRVITHAYPVANNVYYSGMAKAEPFAALGGIVAWGWFAVIVGAASTVAVVVNGSLPRVTPYGRLIGSLFRVWCWAMIAYSVERNSPSPGFFSYLCLACLDVLFLWSISASVWPAARAQSDES